jgi:glycosyltransferase involved in cell wall biosynthesis
MSAPNRPLLSVIVPTLNRPEELRMCLDGFALQTAPRDRFEVIVVDDGSTEDLSPVVLEFTDKLKVVLERREHAGLSAARNAGIDLARGQFLVLYDDDLRPVEQLVDYCLDFHQHHPSEQDAALLYFVPGENVAGCRLTQWAYRELYMFPNSGVHPWPMLWGGSTTCKACLFRHGRFDPAYLSVEDAEFAARISRFVEMHVHFENRVMGTMTRKVTLPQIHRREFFRGYFHYVLGHQPATLWSFHYPPYENPQAYIIHDEPGLRALLASADSLEQRHTAGTDRLLGALCNRLVLHAKAAGWIAASEGRQPIVNVPDLAQSVNGEGVLR